MGNLEKKEKNSIAFSNFFENLNIVNIKLVEIVSYLLPYLFFGREKNNMDCLCLHTQEDDLILEDVEICHICTREMTRKVEGGKYTNRKIMPIQKNADLTEWNEHVEKIEKGEIEDKKGYIHLLFVKAKNLAEWVPCTIETFASLYDFLIKPLQNGSISDKKKIKIKIKKFTECKKKSSSGYDYFCHYLLEEGKHWESVDFSKEDEEGIKKSFKDNSDAINKWLEK